MTAAETQSRLPAGPVRQCFHCGRTPDLQVGPDLRSCSPHAGDVLAHYFETTWDGWQPATVVPLRFGATR